MSWNLDNWTPYCRSTPKMLLGTSVCDSSFLSRFLCRHIAGLVAVGELTAFIYSKQFTPNYEFEILLRCRFCPTDKVIKFTVLVWHFCKFVYNRIFLGSALRFRSFAWLHPFFASRVYYVLNIFLTWKLTWFTIPPAKPRKTLDRGWFAVGRRQRRLGNYILLFTCILYVRKNIIAIY